MLFADEEAIAGDIVVNEFEKVTIEQGDVLSTVCTK